MSIIAGGTFLFTSSGFKSEDIPYDAPGNIVQSAFSTLMHNMAMGIDLRVTVKDRYAVGAYFEHDGRIYKVVTVWRLNADDWFAAEKYELGLRLGHRSPKTWAKTKVEWIEDSNMPRMS